MKKASRLAAMLMVGAATLGFASCGEDDDDSIDIGTISATSENSNPSSMPSRVGASVVQCTDSQHPHAIDLGLPSGTKWACCNVGADAPEAYGNYYAWGETATKSEYTEANSVWYDKYLLDIQATEYDVAHVEWGGAWMMPTYAQMEELTDAANCEWTWVADKQGYYVTSKMAGHEADTLFLPTAGYKYGTTLFNVNDDAFYWSSTPYSSERASYGAYSLHFFFLKIWKKYSDWRYFGQLVRPVCP